MDNLNNVGEVTKVNNERLEQDIYKLLTKYYNTNMKLMKNNLRNECKLKYKDFGGRKGMAELVGLEFGAFQSCLNPSHQSSLTFENLIKICGTFDIKAEKLFANTRITKGNQGVEKTWTLEKKQKFVNDYKRLGVEGMTEEYLLTKKTVALYNTRFSKDLGL